MKTWCILKIQVKKGESHTDVDGKALEPSGTWISLLSYLIKHSEYGRRKLSVQQNEYLYTSQ